MRLLLLIAISLAGGFLFQLWTLPRVGLQALGFGAYLVAWLILFVATFLVHLVPLVLGTPEDQS